MPEYDPISTQKDTKERFERKKRALELAHDRDYNEDEAMDEILKLLDELGDWVVGQIDIPEVDVDGPDDDE